ncbi:MAG: phosphopantothenoylcysteine decarboxylase [Planctomycetota bacterium]
MKSTACSTDRPTLLITAGPSREYFDAVRYLSNASSGRMGVEVAAAALDLGWSVHLALGPISLEPPPGAKLHPFISADELDRLTQELWPQVDAFVATAAVCDYRPVERIPGKRKKDSGPWAPVLQRTPDVLANRAKQKEDRLLVGFALQAEPDLQEAGRKLLEKHLDLIILNSTANLGSTEGDFEWIEAGGSTRSFRQVHKSVLARSIVEFLRESLAERRTGRSG